LPEQGEAVGAVEADQLMDGVKLCDRLLEASEAGTVVGRYVLTNVVVREEKYATASAYGLARSVGNRRDEYGLGSATTSSSAGIFPASGFGGTV
jgi:hypothetical protein